MARIRSILGVIEGSAGGVTFSNANGVNTMRQKVGSNSSNTAAQKNTRARFKHLSGMYAGLAGILTQGLKKQGGLSPYNRFVSQNFAGTAYDAVNMTSSIDFTKLGLSAGSVLPPAGVVPTAAANSVSVAFTNNTDDLAGLATDKVTVVVINKLTGRTYTASGALRPASPQVVAVPGLTVATKGDYAAYAFFTRADGSDASATAYAALV